MFQSFGKRFDWRRVRQRARRRLSNFAPKRARRRGFGRRNRHCNCIHINVFANIGFSNNEQLNNRRVMNQRKKITLWQHLACLRQSASRCLRRATRCRGQSRSPGACRSKTAWWCCRGSACGRPPRARRARCTPDRFLCTSRPRCISVVAVSKKKNQTINK